MKTIKPPKHASFEVELDGTVYDTHKVRDDHIRYRAYGFVEKLP